MALSMDYGFVLFRPLCEVRGVALSPPPPTTGEDVARLQEGHVLLQGRSCCC